MDTGEKRVDPIGQRMVELAKRCAALWNANVLVLPPSGQGDKRTHAVEIDGVGRVEFTPGRTIREIPTVIPPPVKRPGRNRKRTTGGEQPPVGDSSVPS